MSFKVPHIAQSSMSSRTTTNHSKGTQSYWAIMNCIWNFQRTCINEKSQHSNFTKAMFPRDSRGKWLLIPLYVVAPTNDLNKIKYKITRGMMLLMMRGLKSIEFVNSIMLSSHSTMLTIKSTTKQWISPMTMPLQCTGW